MTVRVVAATWHRMIVDEAFAAQVWRDPGAALAGRDLTAKERGWLAGLDPRAVALEGGRATNLLAALIPAFPVSAVWLVGVDLRRFLSSAEMECVVEGRGVAADEFGRWLSARASASADPRAAAVVKIETASLEAQRLRPGNGGSGLALSRACVLLDLPVGAVAAWQELATWVGDPVEALRHPERRPPACAGLGPGLETAAVVGRPNGATVEVLGDTVATWLRSLDGSATRAELVAGLALYDLSEQEAAEVLDDALAAGWLHARDGTT